MENNDKIETSANQQNTKKPISFLEKIKRNKAIIEKAKNYKTMFRQMMLLYLFNI